MQISFKKPRKKVDGMGDLWMEFKILVSAMQRIPCPFRR
jgi:hypothetical protein